MNESSSAQRRGAVHVATTPRQNHRQPPQFGFDSPMQRSIHVIISFLSAVIVVDFDAPAVADAWIPSSVKIGRAATRAKQDAHTCASAIRTDCFVEPAILSGNAQSVQSNSCLPFPDLNLRRAQPEEIDYLSQLVAMCFAKSLDDKGGATESMALRLVLSTQYKLDNFITRWTIYAGMIQRLVVSSFNTGLDESTATRSDTKQNGQPLFVAELLDTNELIGAVELAYGDCPVPFDSDPESSRKAQFICNLAVLPGYRGKGIGKALLALVEEAALNGEGIPSSKGSVTELYLETDYDNHSALTLYKSFGYICEGIDPQIRQNRRAYLRKRITEESPTYSKDILSINEAGRVSYHFSEDDSCVAKPNFIEENFGTLAPVVAALGTFVGIILF